MVLGLNKVGGCKLYPKKERILMGCDSLVRVVVSYSKGKRTWL
jgi:hypothetical protein